MKHTRLFGFLFVILLGLAAGLSYGWILNPAEVRNTSLDSLRSDYQADYVLMVAEIFAVDQDLPSAIQLLKHVSLVDPSRAVKEALVTGQQLNYSNQEMLTLAGLEIAINSEVPLLAQETP